MISLGTLKEIKDLRTVWPHEALDFTKWLAEDENIAILSDAIGIDIAVSDTESTVGDFRLDIFATEAGTNRKIIIENQLEDTNHDHLGKIITYASGKSAEIIIWVVKRAREEHRAAIEWLNNHTDEQIGFFLCEIKLYQIGDSEPAVKFEVIEKPNDWTKKIKENTASSPTEQFRYEYWMAFNSYAFSKAIYAKNFRQRKASTDHWMDLSIGSSACHIAVSQIQKRNSISIEIYINEDKQLFRAFYEKKNDIENEMGMRLDWRELPNRKASRIIVEKPMELENRDKWSEQFEWIIDVTLKMKNTFRKYL